MKDPAAKPNRIALMGNPNSGKTSLFNRLTGARQHVGNYPGVTVEKREGVCVHLGHELHITDLPGTYSLTAYSIEELVARDFIVEEKPSLVIDVLDASNLERNLYLAVQIMELGIPLVLALNMSDVAKSRGIDFDLDRLSKLLGAPIISTVAVKGIGIETLLDEAVAMLDGKRSLFPPAISYGHDIDEARAVLASRLERGGQAVNHYAPEWVALKLLEDDEQVRGKIDNPEIAQSVSECRSQLKRHLGDAPENLIAEARYGFISGACLETVQSTVESRHNTSDRIDAIVMNRVLALPLFLALMYLPGFKF